jgi:serine/threonine protein kinase
MSAGPPRKQPPPELPGYRYLHHIGSGGNAEVFLYEQQRPKREVAVKVLNEAGLTDAVARQFTAEANAMAGLADHPNIASVFTADIAPDGRPYLVMQYYSQPNLGVRARRGHFPVSEVLKVGVQIAGAVETSHRGGILHRDIKPHNILTGKFGTPALTDFGIASAKGAGGAEGMSVPWSPPEVLFGTSDGDERSDVYSLGATLWHLLAGRSPYEVPGGDNTAFALMRRVQADSPPRTGRADVPDSLERLLRQALAKNPDARPQRALDLARELQAIEQELHLPHTQVIVPDDDPPQAGGPGPHTPGYGFPARPGDGARFGDATVARRGQRPSPWDPGPVHPGPVNPGTANPDGWPLRGGDDDVTRQRGPRVLDPQGFADPRREVYQEPFPGPPSRPSDDDVTRQRSPRRVAPWDEGASGSPPPARERVLPPLPGEPDTTMRRGDARLLGGTSSPGFTPGRPLRTGPPAVAGLEDETVSPGPRRRAGLVIGGVLVAAVAAVGAAVALHGAAGGGPPQAPATTALGNGADQSAIGPGGAPPGTPTIATPTVSGGEVHFSWTYANARTGDSFQWKRAGDAGSPRTVAREPISLPASGPGRVCIQVRVVRAGTGQSSPYSSAACG